ncbi:tripartite tricarboxylate transporter substrate binding protein [Pusillimonas sp. TS35]|uniref:Bug family tripartite tricarboxylate transporter substrate binding protein n=1 Tax=Paracandidimonas lactea TaxID=2895524 RepID=UPI00136DC37C|nr:tripartite tricarboxylate transporter substrate binding protein [Paracandidimonas lactea]MYN11790.1 tripartite tricarboxylate transporter substrate binding protein [Pusillimonas sp. TS35]
MAFATAACAAGATPASAAFPEHPVRIVVPFAPGGGTDLISRLLGDGMSKALGQPVIVENKPGAGTTIGSEEVARSKPDGYTLLMATFAHAINPSLRTNLPYDTNKAFAPVILVGHSPSVLVVRPDSPFKSVRDLLDAAKKAPGTVTYASQGVGTSAHLAGELLEKLGKVDMSHVPYRGAGPALNDLLGGHVDMMFGTAAAVGSALQAGTLRALAVTTAQRSPALADIPTIAEEGLAGYVLDSWYGLYAPAGTPSEVIARLNKAATEAAQADAFISKVQHEGLMVTPGTPEELDKYVKSEQRRWADIVASSNISSN